MLQCLTVTKDRQRKYFAKEGSKKLMLGNLMNSFQNELWKLLVSKKDQF